MKLISIPKIIAHIKAISYVGDPTVSINELIDFINEKPTSFTQIGWCNEKNIDKLQKLEVGTFIVSEASAKELGNTKLNLVIVSNPRQAFKAVLEHFFQIERNRNFISASAKIHEDVIIRPGAFIGENVVIEEGCSIGKDVQIGHNTIIHYNTVIGDSVVIGCNNTIGGVGFGYEKNNEGVWEVLPHIGNVIINDKAEIGNNTCIDRAVLGSTIIGKSVKIDNLVHVAHGVKIGDNSLIIAQAMLGGSAEVGKNVWIGPAASIINKGLVNDNALVGMSAVVLKPVAENAIVAGNPARFLRTKTE